MSGLAWVRLDTAFPRNHKVLHLLGERGGKEAGFAYACGLALAGEQGTDGFITAAALPFAHASKRDVGLLTEVGLWVPGPGGVQVHDWADYQQTNDETAKRATRARAAAETRWGKKGSNASA